MRLFINLKQIIIRKDRGKSKSEYSNGVSTFNERLISFMVPFIVVGGLLIAIALTLTVKRHQRISHPQMIHFEIH